MKKLFVLLSLLISLNAVAKPSLIDELIEAALIGNATRVSQLLEKKELHVNMRDKYGCTALIAAASNGHVKVVKMLLSYGAYIDQQKSDGMTALMIAAQKGHIKVVKKLLQAGAQVNLQAGDMTAYLYAMGSPFGAIANLLAQYGAQHSVSWLEKSK